MYKKLVPYVRSHFMEIDQICLKRMAQRLKELIEAKIPIDDPYEIHNKLLPILKACIRGEVTVPFEKENDFISGNFLWDEREGFLPSEYDRQFLNAFAELSMTVRGRGAYQIEKVIKDGITYAYMEFEEPGDWPDLVLKLEDERRREMMGDEYVPVKR